VLELRNPHSVLAALKHRPDDVREIRVPAGKPYGTWADVADIARSQGISVVAQQVDAEARRGKKTQGKSERIGIATAIVFEHPGIQTPAKLLSTASESDQNASGLWLALDCLQDPHNVGAMFRTAAFFGVKGILLTKDRSAPMTGTVYDVAAGGVESVPFCLVPNLAKSLEIAKKAGLWLLGTSEHEATSYVDVLPDRQWLLVIGNEEKGLRRLTLDTCDVVCGIPAQGDVTSLNASVAAAIMIARLSPPA
jgi:23S rRNA (guanosine2251-2'-O)-methyltransferase